MSEPKVLHIILDGESPDNSRNVFRIKNLYDKLGNEFPYRKTFLTKDPRKRILLSPEMWTRTYSGKELSEWVSSEVTRWDPDKEDTSSTKFSSVPNSSLLWNRISGRGYSSFVFPYYAFYKNCDKFDNNQNNHACLRDYKKKLYRTINSGDCHYHRSDFQYYGMHETMEDLVKVPGMKDRVQEMWTTLDPDNCQETLVNLIEDQKKIIYPEYSNHIKSNLEVFNQEIFPQLSQISFDHGGYVHLGMIETDSFLHFLSPYQELYDELEKYLIKVILTAEEIVGFDTIIIHGDHGQDWSRTMKKWYEFDYEGSHYKCGRANHVPAPMFNDHSHSVGGYVMSKSQDTINDFTRILHRQKENSLFMDTVYEYLDNVFHE